MIKSKRKKILILNCGYPKAGSTYVIESAINIAPYVNCININNNANLLECFESILHLKKNEFKNQYKELKLILSQNLIKDINFFGYERSLNITSNSNRKFVFFKRLKKIANDLNLDLKLTIFLRDKLEIIESHYKELYFKLIFKDIKYFFFSIYIKSILNKKEKNLIKNLDYNYNINKICKIIGKKKVLINNFENLKKNKKKTFRELMNFSEIKKFNLNKLTTKSLNSSKNKEFFSLIKLRINDYFFLKKRLSLKTFTNTIEIFLKLIFFQNHLNRVVKINLHSRRELIKLINKN